MQEVAVESRNHEVGREQHAKGVVREHRGVCDRGKDGSAEHGKRGGMSVRGGGSARGARAVQSRVVAVVGEVVVELSGPANRLLEDDVRHLALSGYRSSAGPKEGAQVMEMMIKHRSEVWVQSGRAGIWRCWPRKTLQFELHRPTPGQGQGRG